MNACRSYQVGDLDASTILGRDRIPDASSTTFGRRKGKAIGDAGGHPWAGSEQHGPGTQQATIQLE